MRVSIWLEGLHPAIFKNGIAAEPLERWEDYQEERKWHFMEVVWRGPADRCRQLEKDLIERLSVVQGCDNIKLLVIRNCYKIILLICRIILYIYIMIICIVIRMHQ